MGQGSLFPLLYLKQANLKLRFGTSAFVKIAGGLSSRPTGDGFSAHSPRVRMIL